MAIEQVKENNEFRRLMEHGRETGFLTYDEINDSLVHEELDADQIDEMIQAFADEGIEIVVKTKVFGIPLGDGIDRKSVV